MHSIIYATLRSAKTNSWRRRYLVLSHYRALAASDTSAVIAEQPQPLDLSRM